MRYASLALALSLSAALPASAAAASVSIHSARPFGYFVGDLIRVRVDISAAADATLSAASLPRPGPLTGSLDLKDVVVREASAGGGKIWHLDLTYQNFYVALDVRNIEIPGFAVGVTTPAGADTVKVPAWKVGVSPLREIVPERKERADDYLRPDVPALLVDETRPRTVAVALAAAASLSLIAVARDRGWPPFQRRPARIFSALARRLTANARRASGDEALRLAILEVHRAIDAVNGASLLAEDLPGFLDRRPEFAVLQPAMERFFAASSRRFFGDATDVHDGFDMLALVEFVAALAERERAG